MASDRKTIFLVDDDATNLAVGTNALEDYYDVLTLNSGPRLLKVLEKNIPDLILLDIGMPEMSGIEVIKLLKSNPATEHVPVIFLTAKSTAESEIEGLSLGARDYIGKPFSPPLLLKRIEIHLLIESQKRELLSQRDKLVNFNDHLKEMVESKTTEVVDLQNSILKTMADLVEYRDNSTGAHIDRAQRYFGILLNAMKDHGVYIEEISSWDFGLVLQSSQLHDVGKICVKDSILLKPGKLTPDEFEEIKKHTTFGEKIIVKMGENAKKQTFFEYARILALTHHEKWDGSGYPNGLKAENIPLLGRIMAVVDVYDALISDRPYKKAFSKEEAVGIITSGKGSHFDPTLVDLFNSVTDDFDKIALEFSEEYNQFG
jgi:putative two-component system response regulator